MRTVSSERQAESARIHPGASDPSRQETRMDRRPLLHAVIGKGELIVLVRARSRAGWIGFPMPSASPNGTWWFARSLGASS